MKIYQIARKYPSFCSELKRGLPLEVSLTGHCDKPGRCDKTWTES